MSLENNIMEAMKIAMKNKNQSALAALRAVKSELILAKTSGNTSEEFSEAEENKLLQKLVKQRHDSAKIFSGSLHKEYCRILPLCRYISKWDPPIKPGRGHPSGSAKVIIFILFSSSLIDII